jgi:hypothetical protein
VTATNGDAGTIGIVFFRTNFANYHGVADFLLFVGGDIVIVDEKESVSARNSFGGGVVPDPIPWHNRPSSLA